MIESSVRLRILEAGDLELVERWYQAPHVAANCRRLDAPRPLLGRRIITWDSHPAGYLEWRPAERSDAPGAVELQILIGEPGAVGHGIGRQALRLMLAALSLLQERPLVIVRVRATNDGAFRFFTMAGFKHQSTQMDDEGILRHVLERTA